MIAPAISGPLRSPDARSEATLQVCPNKAGEDGCRGGLRWEKNLGYLARVLLLFSLNYAEHLRVSYSHRGGRWPARGAIF